MYEVTQDDLQNEAFIAPIGTALTDTWLALYNNGTFANERSGELWIGGENRICLLTGESTGMYAASK